MNGEWTGRGNPVVNSLRSKVMALKAIIDSLDGVPEGVAAHYTEKDGKFILGVDPVDGFALEDISGLKSSLAKERKNVKDLNAKDSAFGDLDPEIAKDAIGMVDEMATWTPDEKVREQILAKEKQLITKHAKEMEGLNASTEMIRTQLEDQLIKVAAVEAITEAGGNVALLLPHIEGQTRMEMVDGKYVAQVIDENGSPRVSMKAGSVDGMTIGELVSNLRDSDSYSPAFAGSGASGSGAAGSSSTGSGASGSYKLTWEEAHDPNAYRAAKEAAKSAGSTVEVQPFDQ